MALSQMDWTVLRFWESEIMKDPVAIAIIISKFHDDQSAAAGEREMTQIDIAHAVLETICDSRWIGVTLSKAYIDYLNGKDSETICRNMYGAGTITLRKSREMVSRFGSEGFTIFIPDRKKIGSAENPVTKLFPAAITERRFLGELERITEIRRTVDYEDNRFTSHSLKDFTLKEGEFELPINVKNAGTRFENAFQLVGLNPDDCVPIPAYKAHDAIEKEPNLIYVISVDYNLVKTIETAFSHCFLLLKKQFGICSLIMQVLI